MKVKRTGLKAGQASCESIETVCEGLNCLERNALEVQNGMCRVAIQMLRVQATLSQSEQTFTQTYEVTGCS